MSTKEQGNIGNSLKEVLRAFFNVGGDLIRKAPLLVIIFFGLLLVGIYSLSNLTELLKHKLDINR